MDKVADILVDAMKEALRSVELSMTLAFLAATFLFVHGVQGDYRREIEKMVTRARTNPSTLATAPAAVTPESTPLRFGVPGMGLEGELYSAATIAVVLYWLFTLRAGLRVRQARRIGIQLATADEARFNAMLLYPSLVGAGTTAKVALCAALAALAIGGYLFMQKALGELTGIGPSEAT